MKHVSIVPLIGGETIASEQVYGHRPEYIMSYEAFKANDEHLLNHYEYEVPYYVLDAEEPPKIEHKDVDIVSTVCPCAGLSTLSTTSAPDNPLNEWMHRTASYIFEEVKPRVFWGENAPAFASNSGKQIRDRIYNLGRKHGYTMTVYRTKSLLHGLPQIRERSFYFFWKDSQTPLLEYYNRPYTPIDQLLASATGNTQRELHNTKTPSVDDPFYHYILNQHHGGITHKEFIDQIEKTWEVQSYLLNEGVTFDTLAKWFDQIGNEKQAEKCRRKHAKLESGGGIMYKSTVIPKHYTGAFVGHLPGGMAHPVEDRYLSYREAMTLMGLPQNFELLNPKKNMNHICQNVPVPTAKDMATEVQAYLDGKRQMIDSYYTFQYNAKQEHVIADKDERTLDEFFS